MTQFHVGQKVVCIANGPIEYGNTLRSSPQLNVGSVYTINHIIVTDEGPGLFVDEAEPPEGFMFDARRFRPVIARKTSIKIFQAMLITPKVGISA